MKLYWFFLFGVMINCLLLAWIDKKVDKVIKNHDYSMEQKYRINDIGIILFILAMSETGFYVVFAFLTLLAGI